MKVVQQQSLRSFPRRANPVWQNPRSWRLLLLYFANVHNPFNVSNGLHTATDRRRQHTIVLRNSRRSRCTQGSFTESSLCSISLQTKTTQRFASRITVIARCRSQAATAYFGKRIACGYRVYDGIARSTVSQGTSRSCPGFQRSSRKQCKCCRGNSCSRDKT